MFVRESGALLIGLAHLSPSSTAVSSAFIEGLIPGRSLTPKTASVDALTA
jgi:hypothetical protein